MFRYVSHLEECDPKIRCNPRIYSAGYLGLMSAHWGYAVTLPRRRCRVCSCRVCRFVGLSVCLSALFIATRAVIAAARRFDQHGRAGQNNHHRWHSAAAAHVALSVLLSVVSVSRQRQHCRSGGVTLNSFPITTSPLP